jgi:hypothetical protein
MVGVARLEGARLNRLLKNSVISAVVVAVEVFSEPRCPIFLLCGG